MINLPVYRLTGLLEIFMCEGITVRKCPKCGRIVSLEPFGMKEDICLVCQGKLSEEKFKEYKKESHERFLNKL